MVLKFFARVFLSNFFSNQIKKDFPISYLIHPH